MKKTILLLVITALFFGCTKEDDVDQDNNKIPDTPVAIQAIDVTTVSFTAMWNKATNATSYEIDLAKDSYFNHIIKTVKSTGNSFTFQSLNYTTRYYYRVRALNANKVSPNSNSIGVFTMPMPPVAYAATNISNSDFYVNWFSELGITAYLLYVSTEDFPHDNSKNLPNYNGKVVGTSSNHVVGLSSNTTYYYTLKAVYVKDTSASSNTISCKTMN